MSEKTNTVWELKIRINLIKSIYQFQSKNKILKVKYFPICFRLFSNPFQNIIEFTFNSTVTQEDKVDYRLPRYDLKDNGYIDINKIQMMRIS